MPFQRFYGIEVMCVCVRGSVYSFTFISSQMEEYYKHLYFYFFYLEIHLRNHSILANIQLPHFFSFLPNFSAKWSSWKLVHVYSTLQISWHTAVDSQASLKSMVLKHQSNMANTMNELIWMTVWVCVCKERWGDK